MALVHEAADVTTGERIALKTAPIERSNGAELALRVQLEGLALARIDHPGVVALRDHGASADGVPYVALELLLGETWEDELERGGPQPLGRAARIAADLCGALDAVHRAGVVHRDIKPEHVGVCAGGGVKLFDFGLALLPSGEADWFPPYLTVGTPEYMAPEQWRADPLDHRADIFALGVALFEALTGELPFTASRPEAFGRAILWHAPRRARALRPDLPRSIDELLDAMLAKPRSDRPRRSGEVAAVLERFAEPSECERRRGVAPRDA